jgi:hypothetical protein
MKNIYKGTLLIFLMVSAVVAFSGVAMASTRSFSSSHHGVFFVQPHSHSSFGHYYVTSWRGSNFASFYSFYYSYFAQFFRPWRTYFVGFY